ncbi:hypothetical protein [Acaryochloris sp. IP29b_bin.148]|uniref:hypothetical protein n=1 Tax=Acaryochloris sp. IP29b_bin.148 TaxID=2969218 RepID=UPI0026288817|nr:hypothetical protein [Acaryochloris sp. IP29b_bin.148]
MKRQPKYFQKSLFHLYLRLQRQQQVEGGYSLVVTVAMLLILSTLLISAAIISKVDTVSTTASAKSNIGFYAAEAGLNIRAQEIRREFEGYNRPSGTSPTSWQDCVNGTTGAQGTLDFGCDEEPFQGQQVWTYVEEFPNNPRPTIVADGPFAGLSAQEYIYDVVSVATDRDTLTNETSPSTILGMRFKSRLVPLFQFAAFYEQDMDFAVPPSMTVNGRVHSNNDLYLDASSSGTFSINGQVTSVGKLYRGEKIDDDCSGIVRIDDGSGYRTLGCSGSRQEYTQSDVESDWNGNINVGIDKLTVPEPDQFDAQAGKLYWDKADLRVALVLDSGGDPTGIEVQDVDGSSNSTATTDLRSCSADGVTTTLQNENGSDANYEANDTQVKITNGTGSQFSTGDVVVVGDDIDSNVITSVTTAGSPDRLDFKRQLGHSYQSAFPSAGDTVRKAVVSTSDTFYNYREKEGSSGTEQGRYIRMLDINMEALFDCVQSESLMGSTNLDDDTDGGLVWFFTVKGPDSNTDVTASGSPNNYGVRMYNAGTLASTISGAPTIQGLTVVSDQAIYTRGDYNRFNKKPAAILGDTINVLSDAWKMDDSNGRIYNPLTNIPGPEDSTSFDVIVGALRQASSTTINAAFLAGIDISGGVNQGGQDGGWSSSGGGWNNYPRFHETWSGATLTYRGSMVTLGSPRRVNGSFCGSQSINSSCNIYTPPTRNWDYDTDYDNAANLPPLTPQAVYLEQELFQREFDVSFSNSGKQYIATLPTIQPSFTF